MPSAFERKSVLLAHKVLLEVLFGRTQFELLHGGRRGIIRLWLSSLAAIA